MAELSYQDPFYLQRFLEAQEGIYHAVLRELRSGQKRTHWMWFIFPQVDGLGMSETSRYYAIKSLAEAQAYLSHPILGVRLRECASILLTLEGRTAHAIFGSPDDRKLQSCMTLFLTTSGESDLFGSVLDKYYNGNKDSRTLEILETWHNDYEEQPEPKP